MEAGDGGRGRTEAIARELGEAARGEGGAGRPHPPPRVAAPTRRRPRRGDHGIARRRRRRYDQPLQPPSPPPRVRSRRTTETLPVIDPDGRSRRIGLARRNLFIRNQLSYWFIREEGCLGIVDGDQVELDNLHRQIIHTEAFVGQPKVKSAAAACRALLKYHRYDVIVDATDNLPSRYMISDCCVLMNKPLISGAAVGLEGQLTVYHRNGSPCYRCLDNPPSSAALQSCSDNGILGILPGVIGCLQALEAIKVSTSVGEPLCGRMLLFGALSSHIRIVKIHGSLSTCEVCGENPVFTEQDFVQFDYKSFTQSAVSKDLTALSLNLLLENTRVSCRDYKRLLDSGKPHLLVDVRPLHHFQIASIAHSINVPLSLLEEKLQMLRDSAKEMTETSWKNSRQQHCPVYVICRRGHDSQVAVHILRENGFLYASDVAGGFEFWAKEVDPSFPLY